MSPRRALAAAAAAGGAALAWAAWIEPRLIVTRTCVLRLPGWPAALDGLRVALVSDLHAGAPHVDEERVAKVAERVNRRAPDLVCLLGDFIDPAVALARWVPPEAVAARLAGLRAPLGAIAVLGNHDWEHGGERVAAALGANGIPVLEEEVRAVEHRGTRLWIAGLSDSRHRSPDPEATLAGVPESEPILVLSHDPDVFPRVPARAALTLSGHTHGGQVNVPGLRERVIPSHHGMRYAAGHVVEGGRHLYVTSGVGTSGLPIRWARPPEIVVLTLRRGS